MVEPVIKTLSNFGRQIHKSDWLPKKKKKAKADA